MGLALVAWLALEASATARLPVAAIGLAGVVALAVSLLAPSALVVALPLLGAAYATLLAVDAPPLDTRAAVVGAALVAAGGLADWSRELRVTAPDEPGGVWRRPLWVAIGALLALGLGAALLAVVDLARTEGVAVEALGVVAALAALALVARLAVGPRGVR